jgi:hypothetical protein
MTAASASAVLEAKLSRGPSRIGTLIFGVVLLAGLIFIGQSIARDLGNVELGSAWPSHLFQIRTPLVPICNISVTNPSYNYPIDKHPSPAPSSL